MAFFDHLSKTISEKGKEAAKKAKDLTEVMQLKSQINTEEADVEAAIKQIGKIAFESNLQATQEEYAELFEKVNTAKQNILQIEKKIYAVEGIQVCPQCGVKNPKDSAFCSNCGGKMKKEVIEEMIEPVKEETVNEEVIIEDSTGEEVASSGKRCTECGAEAEEDVSFCTECGCKFI